MRIYNSLTRRAVAAMVLMAAFLGVCSAEDVTITAEVPPVLSIGTYPTTVSAWELVPGSTAVYGDNEVLDDMTINSNSNWQLTAVTNTDTMDSATTDDVLANGLKAKVGAGNFVALSTTPAVVVSDGTPSTSGANDIQFSQEVAYTDVAQDDYSITVTFTLSERV